MCRWALAVSFHVISFDLSIKAKSFIFNFLLHSRIYQCLQLELSSKRHATNIENVNSLILSQLCLTYCISLFSTWSLNGIKIILRAFFWLFLVSWIFELTHFYLPTASVAHWDVCTLLSWQFQNNVPFSFSIFSSFIYSWGRLTNLVYIFCLYIFKVLN